MNLGIRHMARIHWRVTPEELTRKVILDRYAKFVCPEHGRSPELDKEMPSSKGGADFLFRYCCPKLEQIANAELRRDATGPGN